MTTSGIATSNRPLILPASTNTHRTHIHPLVTAPSLEASLPGTARGPLTIALILASAICLSTAGLEWLLALLVWSINRQRTEGRAAAMRLKVASARCRT